MPICSSSAGQRLSDPASSSAALVATISSDLSPKEVVSLLALLEKHAACCAFSSSKLWQTSATAHRIDTDGSRIIGRRPYHVSSSERKIIDNHVSDLLERNIIRPWSSPVVLFHKKDGSVRFCVEYCALNKITRKDVYPMPHINDSLDCLEGTEYFSSIDLGSGYWQIPMHESDTEKTAFSTPDGFYEFNVMPFG